MIQEIRSHPQVLIPNMRIELMKKSVTVKKRYSPGHLFVKKKRLIRARDRYLEFEFKCIYA
jgi:hypothetical protein